MSKKRQAYSVTRCGETYEREVVSKLSPEEEFFKNAWLNRDKFLEEALSKALKVIEKNTKSFSEKYSFKRMFFEELIKEESNITEYIELGCAAGCTLDLIDQLFDSNVDIYGFDTFEGYPQGWVRKEDSGYILHRDIGENSPGEFENFNKLQELKEKDNIHLVKGLFQETLVPFVKDFSRRGRVLLYLNSDLYSSTLFCLCQIHSILRPGDIFVVHCSDKDNEFKAINDYFLSHSSKNNIQFKLVEKKGWMISWEVL